MSNVVNLEEIKKKMFNEIGFNLEGHGNREYRLLHATDTTTRTKLFQLRKMYVQRLKFFSRHLGKAEIARAKETIKNLESQNV